MPAARPAHHSPGYPQVRGRNSYGGSRTALPRRLGRHVHPQPALHQGRCRRIPQRRKLELAVGGLVSVGRRRLAKQTPAQCQGLHS